MQAVLADATDGVCGLCWRECGAAEDDLWYAMVVLCCVCEYGCMQPAGRRELFCDVGS